MYQRYRTVPTGWIIAALLAALCSATQAAVVYVPNFSVGNDYVEWYYGCGPTAGGSVFSYWDRNGYGNLIQGSIDANVASDRHIKYWYEASPSNRGNTAAYNTSSDPMVGSDGFDCIADFMGTSRYNYARPDAGNYQLTNGGTYLWSGAPDSFLGIRSGMKNYANYRGYNFVNATNYTAPSFASFKAEIDAGRPVILLVDTDANGGTDHFVPVFGYNDATNEYFAYDEWGSTGGVGDGGRWETFQAMGGGVSWGVGFMTTVTGFAGADSPEPAVMVLGLMCFGGCMAFFGRPDRELDFVDDVG